MKYGISILGAKHCPSEVQGGKTVIAIWLSDSASLGPVWAVFGIATFAASYLTLCVQCGRNMSL